jgi:hypothetical protein
MIINKEPLLLKAVRAKKAYHKPKEGFRANKFKLVKNIID